MFKKFFMQNILSYISALTPPRSSTTLYPLKIMVYYLLLSQNNNMHKNTQYDKNCQSKRKCNRNRPSNILMESILCWPTTSGHEAGRSTEENWFSLMSTSPPPAGILCGLNLCRSCCGVTVWVQSGISPVVPGKRLFPPGHQFTSI